MTFDELWKREGWFSEDTSEFELAKAAYKAGEEEARATVADKPFNPDWSLPEATAESLREHMALAKAAQESEQRFRAEVAAALREALATLAAIPSGDYSTDGDAEELIRRDLAMAAIVKAMKKLNIPVSYLTQEQPK